MKNRFYGSKADNLEKLQRAGFKVPKFYVIDASSKNELQDPKTSNQIKTTFEKWVSINKLSAVAVRSSSTQEDAKEKSFAGQFKTILNVHSSDEFIQALGEVFSSKQSPSYSQSTGVVHAIIQEFIEPDISGVIFSVNPSSGTNEFVINSARGRGTNVVEGHHADQYIVNRLYPDRRTHIGNSTSPESLSYNQIAELTKVTLDVESLFTTPQDIEWAIKDGVIYILQARPITHISHLRLWDSSNLAESFPGIVLPLTFSIAKRGYMLGYKAFAYSAGFNWYELEAQHRTFDSMVGIFNGRMYYNLLNWYSIISLFPGSAKNQKFLDAQINTQGNAIYQAPSKQSFRYRLKFFALVIYQALFFKRKLNKFYAKFETFENEMALMPKGGDSQTLMLQYSHIEQSIVPHFGRSVGNDFFVMFYHGWLKRLLASWVPNQSFDQINIVGSISGVLSSEQATSLYDMAINFKKDPQAIDCLRRSDYELLSQHLEGTKLQESVALYIEKFGHRFADDQKIEVRNPTLEPYGIYKLMKAYVKLDESKIKDRLANSAVDARAVEVQVESTIGFGQRILYRFLLSRLKNHLRIREKNRLLRGKIYGYMRQLFPVIGQAFVNEGVIADEVDIYYLEIEEIYQLMQGSLIYNDLQHRIDTRRKAYKAFADIDMPARFITTNLPSLEKIEPVSVTRSVSKHKSIPGLISSPGTVEGRAIVLDEPNIPEEPYDILIARHTDPGWTPLIALAKGVVVEHGGMLSHAAIVTRELGIPSIIGVKDVTSLVESGMHVRINTQTSSLDILD